MPVEFQGAVSRRPWTLSTDRVSRRHALWMIVLMSGLGGAVLRRSIYDVEAEIAAAEEAERKAKREARKALLRGRRQRD